MYRIIKRSLPLGLDAFVSSMTLNIPKYCVEYWLGTKALGVFGMLFQLAFSIQLLIGAVGNTGVSMLSESYKNKDSQRFKRLFQRMLITSIFISLLALIGGTLFIPPVMSLIKPELDQQWLVFLLLTGSTLAGIRRIGGRVTQASGNYIWYMIIDLAQCFGSGLISIWLVKSMELPGAAIAIIVGFTIGLVLTYVHTYFLLQQKSPTEKPAVP